LSYTPGSKPVRDYSTNPARVDTVFSTTGQFGNTRWSLNRGIELDANLGRIKQLNTSLYISGAYMESAYKTTGTEYANPRVFLSNYTDAILSP
jgi:hypothetical protein